jgi:hypothetical protein
MKSPALWILTTLLLVAAITALILIYGIYGILASIAISIMFIAGLSGFYRWRRKRLARSILPGESLVANGTVSESTFDETPAILLRAAAGGYRIHVADARGSQVVQSAAPALTSHVNPADLKGYIELCTEQGKVHFAPSKGLGVSTQPAYAQEILSVIQADGMPAAGQPGSE